MKKEKVTVHTVVQKVGEVYSELAENLTQEGATLFNTFCDTQMAVTKKYTSKFEELHKKHELLKYTISTEQRLIEGKKDYAHFVESHDTELKKGLDDVKLAQAKLTEQYHLVFTQEVIDIYTDRLDNAIKKTNDVLLSSFKYLDARLYGITHS